MTGFENQIPGGQSPRTESKGEAAVRWASMISALLRGWPFKIPITAGEESHLAFFFAAIIRRWPYFAQWKAPTK